MSADNPNVILVVTDDQGYGDLGCTGNPWIRTPNIDTFHDESVRLTDFHVSPLCAPTRGALLTGRRPARNGVWGVCRGRSLLNRNEKTMADYFAANGYRTGMFGKWHLGDNYPYRPTDRGFHTAVAHKGGGIGQTPDYWGNNYFDDTYFHDNRPISHSGYCTDVWFDEAKRYIETCGDTPFFVYLATNAPHDPYLVDEEYTAPYARNPEIPYPAFYGMIANLDENFGRLREFLQGRGQEADTILIFMTDNGSSGGCVCDAEGRVERGFNAGMRGKKGSYYEGGHRVPFFIRWPGGGIGGVDSNGGRNVDELAHHIDILPTLAELCGLTPPRENIGLDGVSLASLLRGETTRLPGDRIEFNQFDMTALEILERWNVLVMTRRWRLVRGTELYDIQADPSQQKNVAADHPAVASRLRRAHESWYEEIESDLHPYSPIVLGNPAENPARLDAFDVLGDLPYVQSLVARGMPCSGRWAVEFERPGIYRFALRRWPEERDLPLGGDISPEAFEELIIRWEGTKSRTLKPSKASLTVFGEGHTTSVTPDQKEAAFELSVEQSGETFLEAYFTCADGQDSDSREIGAYYVYVERLDS